MTLRESRAWCEEHGLDERVFEEYREYLQESRRPATYRQENPRSSWWDK